MDLKGQIVDAKVRVIPSKALLQYICGLHYEKDMPNNIAKIIKGSTFEVKEAVNFNNKIDTKLTKEDMELLSKIKAKLSTIQDDLVCKTEIIQEESDKGNYDKSINSKSKNPETNGKCNNRKNKVTVEENLAVPLIVDDVEWLHVHLTTQRNSGAKDVPYLNELLQGCEVETPENIVLKRNPVLEARCVKLRSQQEAREYRAMTKGVDNVRMRFPEDSISYQMKQLNRQLIVIGQFLLSIFAGFLFGFKGVELIVGSLDFGFRLLLGVMCALIIALAEIYFIAKKLNEELSVPETTQIGGPPKFASMLDPPAPRRADQNVNKEHQE